MNLGELLNNNDDEQGNRFDFVEILYNEKCSTKSNFEEKRKGKSESTKKT